MGIISDISKKKAASAIKAFQAYTEAEREAREAIVEALRNIAKASDTKTVELDEDSQPSVLCCNGFSGNSSNESIQTVCVNEHGRVSFETEYGTYGSDEIPLVEDLHEILTQVMELD